MKDQTQGSDAVVCLTLRITLMYQRFLTFSFVVLCPSSLKRKCEDPLGASIAL